MKNFVKIKVFVIACLIFLFGGGAYVHMFDSKYGWVFSDDEVLSAKTERGKRLYTGKKCDLCHGSGGARPIESYPKINGQPVEYVITQIQDIKSGYRNNGESSIMRPGVENLSEEEIEAIAYYLYTVK